ncbi:MAG: arsenate reductase family protein [Lachnospiraceae bacterium]|nr:arsenate reductase family protein [Lachnospiraceae bacterium]
MKVYCYEKCTTCKKALKWLKDHGVSYDLADIKTEHPDVKMLKELQKKSGVELRKFFNTSGQLYRELGLSQKLSDMRDEEMLKLLASDGMLVKRPLLVAEDYVLLGFKEAQWQERMG